MADTRGRGGRRRAIVLIVGSLAATWTACLKPVQTRLSDEEIAAFCARTAEARCAGVIETGLVAAAQLDACRKGLVDYCMRGPGAALRAGTVALDRAAEATCRANAKVRLGELRVDDCTHAPVLVPQAHPGDSCVDTWVDQCIDGACDSRLGCSRCVAFLDAGAACSVDDDWCYWPLLWCASSPDAGTGTCTERKPGGAPCDSWYECLGWYCGNGHCRGGPLGAGCHFPDDCDSSSCFHGHCVETPGDGGLGQPCRSAGDCGPEYVCSPEDLGCMLPLPEGASCVIDLSFPQTECQLGLVCRDRRCTRLPRADETCLDPSPVGARCAFNLACGDAGVCSPLPSLGAACDLAHHCVGSRCVLEELSSRPAPPAYVGDLLSDGGTGHGSCVPRAGPGEICFNYFDCEVGVCHPPTDTDWARCPVSCQP